MNQAELHARALGDHPLLAACVDEHQVFLAVVVEAEGSLLVASSRLCRPAGRSGARSAQLAAVRLMIREELARLSERRRLHLPSVAEPADEAPVAQRLAAEGAGRHALSFAVLLDRREKLLPLVHNAPKSRRLLAMGYARPGRRSSARASSLSRRWRASSTTSSAWRSRRRSMMDLSASSAER